VTQAPCRVRFAPSGRQGTVPAGTSVLEAAQRLGVDLDSVCGGRALCGHCEVIAVDAAEAPGSASPSSPQLSPMSAEEREFLSRRGPMAGRRLGCRARIQRDLVVEVPETSRLQRQLVRKPCEAHDIDVRPVVHPYFVAVEPPATGDSRGDLERLAEALRREWTLDLSGCDPAVAADLPRTLRSDGGEVTAAVRHDGRLAGVWPGLKDRLLGIAVDVGSTTIAAHLCDLGSGQVLAEAGRMNPQIRFGEDLMSRVSHVMHHPDGREELTRAVRASIDDIVGELVTRAGAGRDDVLELTFVGNSIMQHLLLGWDPTELGRAPFTLVSDRAVDLPARDLGLRVGAGTRAWVLPCIAGHIGADMAGVLLAEAPWERDEVSLVVDVGTNAELALGHRGRLLVASSPTGPAFEGAQISCGQRAAPGAIERVRIDPVTLEPRYRVIGSERWSDEPGFERELPACGVTGLCGSGIIEAIAELYLAGVVASDGRILAARAAGSSRLVAEGATSSYVLVHGEPGIRIRQADVRAIQLAKAALFAGARLLMDRLGIERVPRIRLAGGFGAQIDVRYAMILGMIPDCALERVSSAGNAAATGARIALVDRESRAVIERRVREVERVETATEPRFQQYFVEALAIPHEREPFAELRRAVRMPAPSPRRGPQMRSAVARHFGSAGDAGR